MTGAFLITFKRTTAEKKLRWSMDQMHDLVARSKAGQPVVENWRFLNKSNVSVGDRVFLCFRANRGRPLSDMATQLAIPGRMKEFVGLPFRLIEWLIQCPRHLQIEMIYLRSAKRARFGSL